MFLKNNQRSAIKLSMCTLRMIT